MAGSEEVRWVRRPDALWRVTPTALVVLPSGAAAPLVLDGVAPRVWELLADALPTAAIMTLLAAAWGEDPALGESEVVAVLERLVRIGAVDRSI